MLNVEIDPSWITDASFPRSDQVICRCGAKDDGTGLRFVGNGFDFTYDPVKHQYLGTYQTHSGYFITKVISKRSDFCIFIDECKASWNTIKGVGPDTESVVNENGGNAEYLRLLDELRELHIRKAADYGTKSDPLANYTESVQFGVPNWIGVMVRANDKMRRIKAFCEKGNLKNESVEDSLKDLAAHALIALVLYREQTSKS